MLDYVTFLLLILIFISALVSLRAKNRTATDLIDRVIDSATKVLFVIAHPDDECMFFSPTIIRFVEKKKEVFVLCLSTGNRYGRGNIRKNELRESCRILGVDPSNVMIINHTQLPDDNFATWKKCLLGNIILSHMKALGIDMLVTFDEDGVSGHRNHRALHKAVSLLFTKDLAPPECEFYILNDVSIFRKYLGILDVPLTLLTSRYVLISSYEAFLRGRMAMQAHQSQMVWYRKLYLLFSRYMIVNDLRAFNDY